MYKIILLYSFVYCDLPSFIAIYPYQILYYYGGQVGNHCELSEITKTNGNTITDTLKLQPMGLLC